VRRDKKMSTTDSVKQTLNACSKAREEGRREAVVEMLQQCTRAADKICGDTCLILFLEVFEGVNSKKRIVSDSDLERIGHFLGPNYKLVKVKE
jgi:hypothetical protein